MRQRRVVAAIQDLATSVENSSEHLLADANLGARVSKRDRIATTQTGDLSKREKQRFLIAKADDLGFRKSLSATMNSAQRPDRNRQVRGGNRQDRKSVV